MLVFTVALFLIVLVALAVIAYAAFPARDRPLPGPERVREVVSTVEQRLAAGEAPPHGLLDDPELRRRVSGGFERAEHRVVWLVDRLRSLVRHSR